MTRGHDRTRRACLAVSLALAGVGCSSGDGGVSPVDATATDVAHSSSSQSVDASTPDAKRSVESSTVDSTIKTDSTGDHPDASGGQPDATGVTCSAGEKSCPSGCANTMTDPDNCGGCGTTCTGGQVCSGGHCALSCGGGTTMCGASCVDEANDPANCGMCGMACTPGEVCSGGKCGTTCLASQMLCSGGGAPFCASTQSDSANCGACGVACGAGMACSNAKCSTTCGAGEALCSFGDSGPGGSYCANEETDNANCGGCGTVCTTDQVCSGGHCGCPGGTSACAAACVDTQTDNANCGACANACLMGETCTLGKCVVSCPGVEVACGGACIEPASDPNYCGASGSCSGVLAGTACSLVQHCSNGVCCPAGQINCGGHCIDPSSTPGFCGASGTCTGASAGASCNASQVCVGGKCLTTSMQAYTITTASPLTNLFPNTGGCGGSGAAQNNCSAPFGFSWTDTGAGSVLGVVVQFVFTGSCAASGTDHPVTLNGTMVGDFTNTVANGCGCAEQPISVTPSTLMPYAVGGANTFIIDSTTCDAIEATGANVLATVTVEYGN